MADLSGLNRQLGQAIKKPMPRSKFADIGFTMDAESIAKFSRELKKVDPELRKQWAAANREIGKDWQQQSLYWMSQLTRTGKSKKLKKQIKRSVTTKRVLMKLDKQPGNFIMGTEYGSHKYKQFEPSTNPVRWPQGIPVGGYGVHEAIRRHMPEYRDRYLANIKDVFDELDIRLVRWSRKPAFIRGRKGKPLG